MAAVLSLSLGTLSACDDHDHKDGHKDHAATEEHMDHDAHKGHDHSKMSDYKVGDLTLSLVEAKATPEGAPVGAGYLTIKNNGSTADFLVSGEVDFADHVEVHEMKMNDGVMQMRKLDAGVEIPAGGEVVLEPGGFHLMFMKLKEQLKTGEMRKARLTFKNAGEVEVEFAVQDIKGHKH